ncbi:MAG TPA: putative LPS assembly protein LptD, partial [Arachidicoccus sp.]|nr:putative LPS assembly protein LptD [Arachidicoccus sp.]
KTQCSFNSLTFRGKFIFFPTSVYNLDSLPVFFDTIPAHWADSLPLRTPKDAFVFSKKPPKDLTYLSKDSIPDVFDYKATDSSVFFVQKNLFSLHKEADIKNPEYDISGNYIGFDKNTNIITAFGAKDTSDNIYGKPTIVQQGSKSIMDSLRFNVKTKKGILKNTYYNEGEIFVKADIVKKIDSNALFAKDARFTTCNLDPPHFDFHAFKMKMITGKLAVSGPAIPEFEGVPMPIIVPFGIYPLTRGRHSGFLPPTFEQNSGYGLGFNGLGYYKVINDYWDVTTRANIYSYGGYMITVNPNYYKRYKYRGSLNLQYQFTKILNNSGIARDEYTKSTTIHIGWSHSMDSKARPGVSFSANVNAGSTKYNSYLPNNLQNITNQMSSSVTWGKTWDDGKYNLSVAGNHNQNNNLHLINVQLPTVNFSMATVNPFQKKEQVGKPKWYENLGISYNGTLLNQFSFYDTAFNFQQLKDTMLWGAQHQIPISLTLPAVGPLLFTPSISYAENWYSRKMDRHWEDSIGGVDTTVQRGFFAARQMSFGIAMNTRIFGTLNFKKGKIMAIRHEIRPTISLNYQPDMNRQNYQNLEIKTDTTTRTIRVSKYEGNIVGAFGEGSFGGINFGLDNILQMKVRNDNDTTGDPENATKKVSLIDGLSINTGYNMIADTLKWQPINISLRTALFNNKMNVNASMVIDQYATDAYGQRINDLLWKHGKIGNITSGNISMSTSFQSKKTDQRSDQQRIEPDPNMPYDQQQRQMQYVRDNPAEFVDFNIPWNLQASFALGFFRVPTPDYRSFRNQITSSVNLNGDFSLTPKWKAGGSMYFDVKTHSIQMLSLFLTREMHCWQMSINVSPIGRFKSFSIILNPKSGILRDLKINRSRSFYN